ncbi:MAG: hypothetical protein KKD83_10665 [Chloroflexi bacterium]|nr:hypothetical protein [Chloroflexota bacterium]
MNSPAKAGCGVHAKSGRPSFTGSSFALPVWATYTLVGIGIIIFAFLAFRGEGRDDSRGKYKCCAN